MAEVTRVLDGGLADGVEELLADGHERVGVVLDRAEHLREADHHRPHRRDRIAAGHHPQAPTGRCVPFVEAEEGLAITSPGALRLRLLPSLTRVPRVCHH